MVNKSASANVMPNKELIILQSRQRKDLKDSRLL